MSQDERFRKDQGDISRESRADGARQDDRSAADAEARRRAIRDQFLYQVLPTPPEMDGFHFIWLSTTNQQDPLERRLDLGYSVVKPEEVRSWAYAAHNTKALDNHGSCVRINEMVLCKIPTDLFLEYMAELHHNAPLEEESRLRDSAEALKAMAQDSQGRTLVSDVGDGFGSLGRNAPRPSFEV